MSQSELDDDEKCGECASKGFTKLYVGVESIILYDLRPPVGGLEAAGWIVTRCPYCEWLSYWEPSR